MKNLYFFLLGAFIVLNNSANSQPTISSFAPTSGPIGTTVTIIGTNFNTILANNIVFFGATMATVSVATSTSLTVTVPTGATYQDISITNLTTNLTAYSSQPFIVGTACGGIISASSFAPRVDISAGVNPKCVSIGDLDGDGKPDLVVTNPTSSSSNTVSVFLNTSSVGTISFATKIDFITGVTPYGVSIGDIDGDGKLDLVVTNVTSNTVSVFLNTCSLGTISFATKVDFTTGIGPESSSIGDLDGDGKPELAVTNTASNTVSTFLNTSSVGTISFATKVDFTTGIGPVSCCIGDLEGDGKPDIAVANSANSNSNTVSVFKNTSTIGTISFASKVDYSTWSFPNRVSMGDLDGDGKLDLAVSNNGSQYLVAIFKNTSSGGNISFAPKTGLGTLNRNYSVAINDLNGDGKLDLAIVNSGFNSISLFKNISTTNSISFSPEVVYTVGTTPKDVLIGDLDGDGKSDLSITNSGSNSISVFRNLINTLTMTNANTATICSGSNLSIPLLSSSSSTYTWVASDNPNTTGESTTTQTTDTLTNIITNTSTSVQTITYTVTPTSTIGCGVGASQTITVSVNPLQIAMTNSSTKTIYNGDNVNISLTSNNTNYTYTWVATDNPNITGESSMTQTTNTISDILINNTTSVQTVIYTATPTSAVGCGVGTPQTILVLVNPQDSIYPLSAQSTNWQGAIFAGGSNDMGNSIATDVNGNVYVTGDFRSPNFILGNDTLINHGTNSTSDVFIAKYNSSGNILWAKSEGGNSFDIGNSITTDANGNVYITGYFASPSITFGNIVLTNVGGAGVFVVKYDPTGNVIWAKEGSGSAFYNFGTGIYCDINGNVIVTGRFQDNTIMFGSNILTNNGLSNSSDIFIIKYDSNGNEVWAKSAGGSLHDFGTGVSTDLNGNIYITGYFYSSSISFGNIVLANPGFSQSSTTVFVVKYDSMGNSIWAKCSDGNSNAISKAISNDKKGNSYITGFFTSALLQFGSITLPHSNDPSNDLFVAKYDSLGNVIWAKSAGTFEWAGVYGNIQGNSVVTDVNGSIYITGSYSNAIIFNNDTIINSNYNSGHDVFVVKYNENGNYVWAKSAGGLEDENGLGITTNAAGSIYITGFSTSFSLAFGNYSISGNSGSTDMFIAKLEDGTSTVWPGDANHDCLVNNNDLLPVGLYYGQTGTPRTNISNLWQGYAATDWGIAQSNNQDIKYANCNGDGIIDAYDTLAINLNFNLTHAIPVINNDSYERTSADMYFVTNSSSFNPGDWVDAQLWLGTSSSPITDLYGIAFNIHYDAALVQPGTESITYPASWLGTSGTDALKISKIDALANTAYGGITRTDQTNANGYGKIAAFKFQIKTSLTSATTMFFSVSNYKANDATGTAQTFTSLTDSILIYPLTTGINEPKNVTKITVSPNPFTSQVSIKFNEDQKNCTLKIIDVLGKEVKTINFSGKQCIIERGEMQAGVYFLQIKTEQEISVQKLIINK